jgi:hypothetical protein
MSGWGWRNWQNEADLRHRLTVSTPMSLLGIADNLVSLVTLGYLCPGMALDFAFRAALKKSRAASPPVAESVRGEQE